MTGRIITVGALVALAQAKAIITNHCPREVYIWSVPNVGSAYTNNLPLPPGARYEEPWRYGTSGLPGIALKISPQPNGINESKDEINFAYSIDRSDQSKVWVDLSPVRGRPFDQNLAFYTCLGVFDSTDVQTRHCDATDDIELVLCGGARSSNGTDSTSLQKITDCYDYHSNRRKIDKLNEGTPDVELPEPISHEHTATTILTVAGQNYTVTFPGHRHTITKNATTTTLTVPGQNHTVTLPGHHHTITKNTTFTKEGYKHTVTYYLAPEYTTETSYEPSHYSSEVNYKPPLYTSEENYDYAHHTLPKHYDHPQYTSSKHYEPPQYTSNSYPHDHTSKVPCRHTKHSSEGHSGPSHHTLAEPYDPPRYTSEHSYQMPSKYTSQEPHYSHPSHSTIKAYSPPHTDKPYVEPPQYTSKDEYGRPPLPSYQRSYDEWNGDYYHERSALFSKPRPTGGDRVSRRGSLAKPYDYCRQRIVPAQPDLEAPQQNSTVIMGRHLTTVSLKTVVRSEAMKHEAVSAKPVQKPSVSLVSKKEEKCILPYCHPKEPGLDCAKVKDALEEPGEHSWVQDGPACSSLLYSGTTSHIRNLTSPKLLPMINHGRLDAKKRQQVCIAELCREMTNRECEGYEDLLEETAKERGYDFDYTTDDDACDPNKVNPKEDMCILPFCEGHDSEYCSIVKKLLEKMWKEVGWDVDYTSDEEVCATPVPLHGRRVTPVEPVKICLLEVCHSQTKDECDEFKEGVQDLADWLGVEIEFTMDEEAEACIAASGVSPGIPSRVVSSKSTRHVDDNDALSYCQFCEPAVPNQNCQDTARMLNLVFRRRNVNLPCDFRPNDWQPEDCALRKQSPLRFHKKPAVCIRTLCRRLAYTNHECEQIEDELEAATKSMFNQRVDYTTDDDVCY